MIFGAAPTGAWSGWADRLVQRIGGAWQAYAACAGLRVFDAATLAAWVWNGSAWAPIAPRIIDASASYDPPSITAGTGVTTTLPVTGAALRAKDDETKSSRDFRLEGAEGSPR